MYLSAVERWLRLAAVLGCGLIATTSSAWVDELTLVAAVAHVREASSADQRALCRHDCGAVRDPDLRAFCGGRCERVRDPDTRAMCGGDCGAVQHVDLRALCLGQCQLAHDPDFVALCEGRCDSVRDASLQAFCRHDCGALGQSRPPSSQASQAMPSH